MRERRAEDRYTWVMGEVILAGYAGENVRSSRQGVMLPQGGGKECQFVGTVCLAALGADDLIHFLLGGGELGSGNGISLAAERGFAMQKMSPLCGFERSISEVLQRTSKREKNERFAALQDSSSSFINP